MTQAPKTKMFLFFMFRNIFKQKLDAGDLRIMLIPIEKICHTFLGFAADHKRMASAALIIKKGVHIDIYLKLIFVQMDIVV